MSPAPRVTWQQQHVVDVRDAAFAARTYYEQRDLRAFLRRVTTDDRLGSACEVGSGFGRLTIVLTEFADRVFGFEREPHFVQEASVLLPDVRFTQVATLASLPVASASMDLALTFTVLQHLTDTVAAAAAGEIVRLVKPGGHVLICEETDPAHRDGAVDDPHGMCTIGRTVAEYQRLFGALDFLDTAPRRIEPTYPRPDVGTYMLFRKPA